MVIMRSGTANSVGWVEEVETKGFIFCKLVTSVTTFLTQRRKWLTTYQPQLEICYAARCRIHYFLVLISIVREFSCEVEYIKSPVSMSGSAGFRCRMKISV